MPVFPVTVTDDNGDDHQFDVKAANVEEAFEIADLWAEDNL